MRKIISFAAVICMAVFCLTSCLSNDNSEPQYTDVTVSHGVYVACEGSAAANLDGSLTYFNYESSSSKQFIYQSVNHEPLGKKVTDAAICGSKMYILAPGNKKIYVTNKISVAKTNEIAIGDYTARHITADNKNVYVSTADSKILVIDTISCTISKTYDCGANSKAIRSLANYIVVANGKVEGSDKNGSVTVINTEKSEITNISGEGIVNPADVVLFGDMYGLHIYVVDHGTIDDKGNQTGQSVYEAFKTGKINKICAGTHIAMSNRGNLYVINAPKTTPATQPTYMMYNLINGVSKRFISGSDIEFPAAIAVDNSYNGNQCVIVTSYGTENGKISDKAPGKAIVYTYDGQKVKTYDVGSLPTAICINYDTQKVRITQ